MRKSLRKLNLYLLEIWVPGALGLEYRRVHAPNTQEAAAVGKSQFPDADYIDVFTLDTRYRINDEGKLVLEL